MSFIIPILTSQANTLKLEAGWKLSHSYQQLVTSFLNSTQDPAPNTGWVTPVVLGATLRPI